MVKDPPGWIRPGDTARFIYVGMMIPNQIDVANTDDADTATYTSEGGGCWKFYGSVPPMQTASLFVEWFDGIGSFTNTSANCTIVVSGDGLRPYDPEADEA